MARSISAVASGRPAPRYGATGVAFVTTLLAREAMRGIVYTPESISWVVLGQERPDRVRAHVGEQVGAQAHDRAVALRADLHELHLRAAVGQRDEALRT